MSKKEIPNNEQIIEQLEEIEKQGHAVSAMVLAMSDLMGLQWCSSGPFGGSAAQDE